MIMLAISAKFPPASNLSAEFRYTTCILKVATTFSFPPPPHVQGDEAPRAEVRAPGAARLGGLLPPQVLRGHRGVEDPQQDERDLPSHQAHGVQGRLHVFKVRENGCIDKHPDGGKKDD